MGATCVLPSVATLTGRSVGIHIFNFRRMELLSMENNHSIFSQQQE